MAHAHTIVALRSGKYTTNIGLQDSVIHSTEPRGLSLDEDILPQRLAAVGYRTLGVSPLGIDVVP
jgi:hypothetical protein